MFAEKLNIASFYDKEATDSANPAEITTNATAGKAILLAQETEMTIYNQNITKDSLIYITPISNPNNQVLYIKNKKAPSTSSGQVGYFKVAIDNPITYDIKFNWWIIN